MAMTIANIIITKPHIIALTLTVIILLAIYFDQVVGGVSDKLFYHYRFCKIREIEDSDTTM